MDIFGSTDPRKMPGHLFNSSIYKNYDTAIRGNLDKQNFSVCPRHWYFDAIYDCESCKERFTWTADEQKSWFEEYHFWVDSEPRNCKKCSADKRRLKKLRQEYDLNVTNARNSRSIDEKKRIIYIVECFESYFSSIPDKMVETKNIFSRQIIKM